MAATANTKLLLKSAVQQNPINKTDGLMERLFRSWFNGFVYNQIWEDPDVDAKALELTPESKILTISSGGCNVLNYLTYQPCSVVAVDLNRYHMYLLRLKLAALKNLPDFESFFNFFAVASSEKNIENYHKYVRQDLDAATREFWEGGSWIRQLLGNKRINYFKKNLFNYSRSGYYLRFLHAVNKLAKGDMTKLLEAKSLEEQKELFEKWLNPSFDHWLVKTLGKLPMTVYSLGIPPQQFKHLKNDSPDGIISVFRERVRRLACDFPIDENYFAWQAFGRKYKLESPKSLPPYLREANYEFLKRRVQNVETHITSLSDYLRHQEDNSLDRFVFLDSQDWMTSDQLEDLWRQVARAGKSGSRIIFRTGGSQSPLPDNLSPELLDQFSYEEEQSKELYGEDRSAVYGGFHLYVLKN